MVQNQSMLCPCCKSDLVITGKAYLETVCEHVECIPVSLKNKFECSNLCCSTRKLGIVWNDYGERYGGGSSCNIFIDGNDGPFGSFSRKANVEINKKDENYTIFRLGKIRFEAVFSYVSNENGEILDRRRRVRVWIRSELGGETLYLSGVRMFRHSYSTLNNLRKQFCQFPNSIYRDRILDEMKRIDRRWWKIAARWSFRLIHLFFYFRLRNWNDCKNRKGYENHEGTESIG